MAMKTGVVKTVLIVVILLLVGVLAVLGVNTAKTYIGGASADTMPKSVLAKSAEEGKSATVTWNSDKATVGVVEYGTSPAALLLRAPESDSVMSHNVVISPLKPNINYYFRIRVGEEVFDNNGIPYSFKTTAIVVAPTIVVPIIAIVTPIVTPSSSSVVCKADFDFNKDGVINSRDMIDCLKTRPIGIPKEKCQGGVDFDGNGMVNSLDKIRCLQNK